jgi:hypothetical protein
MLDAIQRLAANRTEQCRDYLPENEIRYRRSLRAVMQEVMIECGDFLAEEDAVSRYAANPCRQRYTRGTKTPAGEDWDHDHVIGEPITHIFRNDQDGPRLVRIIRLSWEIGIP